MQPFSNDECLVLQTRLNENYSRHGRLDVSEDKIREITNEVVGIDEFETKGNFLFYDCRTPWIGIEYKKREFADPVAQCGSRKQFTFSRAIDGVPTGDPVEALNHIVDAYNAAIDEFNAHCGGNTWFACALHNDDTLVYFFERIHKLDASKLEARWDWSAAKTRKSTRNLYVVEKDTGTPVFTYLTKGEKLQLYVEIPPLDQVHVFKAEQTHVYKPICVKLMRAIEAAHESFEAGIAKLVAQ